MTFINYAYFFSLESNGLKQTKIIPKHTKLLLLT